MTPFSPLADLIAPTLNDMGFELVQVMVMGAHRKTVQVMAEPIDRARGMTVDDCAEISHAVSAVLDVADPIAGAYSLEVSSPGIDRPLTRADDYARFAGLEAKVEVDRPIEGRKRFTGILRGTEGDEVVLEAPEGAYRLSLARIRRAKLVLNDALLAQAKQRGLG